MDFLTSTDSWMNDVRTELEYQSVERVLKCCIFLQFANFSEFTCNALFFIAILALAISNIADYLEILKNNIRSKINLRAARKSKKAMRKSVVGMRNSGLKIRIKKNQNQSKLEIFLNINSGKQI